MNISSIFIHRPVMTILVMLSIVFFGIVSFQKLPISDLPNVSYPTINVSASYPGANPEIMANNVASPLEKQFLSMQNVNSITSSSSSGSTSITIQFDIDRNIDIAAQDVQAAINRAVPQLPQNLPYSPTYSKVNPAASPVLYIALTSATMPLGKLYDFADAVIGKQISLVKGVAQVANYGSPFAVRIQVDPQKLTARNISIDEFGAAIKVANVQNPVGTLYGPDKEFTIFFNGQMPTGDEYKRLIIKSTNIGPAGSTTTGPLVRVEDVADAFDSIAYDKYYMRYVDATREIPCIIMGVQTQPGVNALEVINGVHALIPDLEAALPGAVQLRMLFDKSEYIYGAVHDVEFTLIAAFILVIIVIFAYLGKFRDTFIPGITIPICIIAALAVMQLCGYTIDILSLLAITLSIGFLVDDAIVVLENIVRHVEEGKTPYESALEGSKEISMTIVSMTLCLLAVFIPLIFMGGILGKIFREFSVIIFSIVLISGFISLSLTPMLCSRLIPARKTGVKKTGMERFSEKLNILLLKIYRPCLEWAIHHRIIVFCVGLISLAGTIVFMRLLPTDFIPTDDIGFITAFGQAPDGTSPFLMKDYQKKINEALIKNPSVQSLVSLGSNPSDNQSLMFIRLKDAKLRPPILDVIQELYTAVGTLPGARVFFRPYPLINLQIGSSSSSTKGDYQYTLKSLKQDILYKSSNALVDKMRGIKDFQYVSSDLLVSQPQLNVIIDRERASMLGVSANALNNALNFAYAGGNLTPINLPENQYYVIMETLPKYYKDPEALSQLYIRSSNNNTLVPLDQIATFTQTPGPLSINHINGLPAVTVTFNIGDEALGPVLAKLDKVAKDTLDPRVFGKVEGIGNVFQTAFANIGFLILMTMFIIYIVLGILYENFFHPLTVMSTLPPAALGAFISLVLTGHPLSLYAFVGIILLLGIVLKNGIIMIDFANDAVEKKKMNIHDAIVYAATTRFRPILMTTISALVGAIPVALGIGSITAQTLRPLGIVIVGGLFFSQILTLFFTPVTYIMVEAFREKFFHKKDKPLDTTGL